ncbi:hypothetical protein CTAYLR_002840 [Chrysophaeum taylorii]|uniref:Mercuric reductase n=1 Tax=Chrysophaeum taylorii TaxID=2483200 RepID=A0AAD7XL11_9STRA|nr:hypothetical protein CTAYLR_002840 [Chrysophaeum taylorii]
MEEEARAIVGAIESGETTVNELLGRLYRHGKSPDISVPKSNNKAPAAVAPEYPMGPAEDPVVAETIAHIGPHHFPSLKPKYDLVVIGAGVAGLLSVIVAKSLGKKALLVEKHYMGGDCLVVGCFPSKCVIACARRAHELRRASDFGIKVSGTIEVDFPAVMRRMRKLRGGIAPHDGVERYLRDFCEDVAIAHASFVDAKTILLKDSKSDATQTVSFDKCVVAAGASAAVVPIPGLRDTPHFTNGNLFNIEELPPRACLIGAGPIGIEMAQALQRFGCAVTIFEISDHLLPREDPDAAKIVTRALLDDGVDVQYSVKLHAVKLVTGTTLAYKAPWPLYRVEATLSDGTKKTFECEALLNATGRAPNTAGLGLDDAGIEYDSRSGIHVNDFYQTSNPDVFAAGDVCSPFKFTHAADFMGRCAVRNAFLDAKDRHSQLLVPWATYTDPEVAHVGLYERELDAAATPYDSYVRHLADVDRCKAEGVTTGFVKISCAKGTDTILGATIVGPNAGDMISEISVAIQNGLGCGDIAGVMHPYPTSAEAVRQCAAQFLPKLRTPAVDAALNLRMGA